MDFLFSLFFKPKNIIYTHVMRKLRHVVGCIFVREHTEAVRE